MNVIRIVNLVLFIALGVYFFYWRRRIEKLKNECVEILEKAKQKREAAKTILEFAEVWRRPMSDDERTNLIIEWHQRLIEANIIISMSQDE